MKSVGIPSALFYYYYFPLYKTFFEHLGCKVIKSSKTGPITIDEGIKHTVDETCFPVKVYMGHVSELCREEMDYLFVPRIVSIESRSYICPKFMGVPDMVRASFAKHPPLIDPIIDISKNNKTLMKEVLRAGKFFTRRGRRIKDAYQHGLYELEFCRAIASQGYTMSEAIDIWEGQDIKIGFKGDICIGLMGHGYSLYDETLSMGIIKRLREMGCQVILPEFFAPEDIEKEAGIMPKRIFWTLGRKMLGTALSMEKRDDIDGMIYVACFGCGPDSLVGEIIERKIKSKPFMLITIDEHTGEAGILTRLEAFCDMLRRRRRLNLENNISAYGQCAGTDCYAAARTEAGCDSTSSYKQAHS